MITRRYGLLLAALGAVLLVSCVLSLGFGPARVPVDVVWRILMYKRSASVKRIGRPGRNISCG